jgi:F0F1-type ATP synthase assembly protein I
MADLPQDDRQKTPERPAPGESQSELRAWHRLAGVGFEFVVALVLFGFLGRWLDGKAGTAPWLMVAGFCVGFVAGLWLLIRTANRSFHD